MGDDAAARAHAKLEALYDSMPEDEQAVLAAIVGDAALQRDANGDGDEVSGFASSGIAALIAVTQAKTNNANEDAMASGQRQQQLVQKRQAFGSLLGKI